MLIYTVISRAVSFDLGGVTQASWGLLVHSYILYKGNGLCNAPLILKTLSGYF